MKRIFLLLCMISFISVGYSQVTVTSRDTVDCTHPQTLLSASFFGDNPTDAGIRIDDQYPSATHSIGFNFSFYGINYNTCLIGPNGTISFDTSLVGAYAPYVISAVLLGNPSVYNSICGPWCDIDVTGMGSYTYPAGGTITYSRVGTAPYRRFIVTFCRDAMYSCITQYTSTQIILYETTNIIETHVAHKTICSWNGGYAIIGVQNRTGSAATVAPGRDFPSTYTCTDEAWRFTPNSSGSSYTVASIPFAPIPYASSALYWYNANTGAYLGTGATMMVSPTATTTYKTGALGCTDTSFGYYTVVPNFITIAETHTEPTACGACDGTITLSGLTPGSIDTVRYVYGGTGRGPIIQTVSATGTITLTGLCAGAYTAIVVNEGQCRTNQLDVTLTDPPVAINVIGTVPPSVCGYGDGSIILGGLAGTTRYTVNYLYNGSPVGPRSISSDGGGQLIINNLFAGTYTNITTTGGPCVTLPAGPAVLVNPAPPTVSMDSSLVKTCIGVPVQLHAYPSITGISYTYTWTPGTYLSNSSISDPLVTPTVAGDITYTVTINPSSDPACASRDTVRVHTLAPFILGNVDTFICRGEFVNTRITGSNEFTYRWAPPAGVSNVNIKTPRITPTISNTYIVRANYARCPEMLDSFRIDVDTPSLARNVSDTICLGMTDTFDFTVPGTAYYHYQWTPTAGVSNDTMPRVSITPPTVGSNVYNLIIQPRAAGCATTNTVTFFVLPNSITVTPPDTAICLGNRVQAIGTGDIHFRYQWLPTAGIAVSNVLNALIRPDTTTTYVVYANFGRCPVMTDTIKLDVQPNPAVYVGGNKFLCDHDSLHMRAAVSPSWYPNYRYSWTPVANLDLSTSATVVFTGHATTKLYVEVSTPFGCKGYDSSLVTVIPGDFITTMPDLSFCPGDTMTLSAVSTVPGVTYRWLPSYYISDSNTANTLIKPVANQVYTLIGTVAAGCTDTINFNTTVHPAAVVQIPDSITLYPGESSRIVTLSNAMNFNWFPVVGLNNPYVADPVASPEISTRYYVEVQTDRGCKAKDSVDVVYNTESTIAMPNAFSPGSGVNNEFKPNLRGLASLNYFRIYNRWGNLLFETKNPSIGWDGSFNGAQQPMGVYIYEIQAVMNTGKLVNKVGNITLLR